MMKKIISLLLLIAVILGIITGCSNQNVTENEEQESETIAVTSEETTQETYEHITDVPEGYIGIYTVDDLINSNINKDANYILMNDLDLSEYDNWNSITNNCIFNGNNYVIKNLKSSNKGLFYSANDIYNLTLENVYIEKTDYNESGVFSIGGIVAECNGTIDNCTISGKIVAKGAKGGKVGAIAAEANNISNCISRVDIDVRYNVYGLGSGVYGLFGGIVGEGKNVYNCKNYGNINANCLDGQDISVRTNYAAGGILGGLSSDAEIIACANYGNIVCPNEAAGILGRNGWNSDKNITISNCFNIGSISCVGDLYNDTAGGIVSSEGHWNNVHTTIMNCYNVGNVTGAQHCGAILGEYDGSSIVDISYCCYDNENGLNITDSNGMFANNKAMSLSEMKDINNYPFNNIDDWENTDDSFPQYVGGWF